ncbi:bactofilin family protein [Kiloniella antarctica]|uniref:Polymer-forming cytoskeletal protein n=1 Tax=Kiloniella antarctica TaxID=1550907 RepID=A0ABW5BMI3_9PROT
MFSKSNKKNNNVVKSDSPSKKIEASGIPSILSPDLNLTGDLSSVGDLQIDGTVQGDVTCRSVTIGEKAVVTGSVNAEEIRVCGMVSGQLNATTITLASTAKVIGDIMHKSIAIEAGAQVEGQFRRISEHAPKAVTSNVAEKFSEKTSTPVTVQPTSGTTTTEVTATTGDSSFANGSGTQPTSGITEVKTDVKAVEKKPNTYGSSWNNN